MLNCTPAELGEKNLPYSQMSYLVKYVQKKDDNLAKKIGREVAIAVAELLSNARR